jgi:thioredoxin reductase (NADPH)
MGVANKTGQRTENVLILGAGPAGLSAAIYAARADLEPLVLTGLELGGQVSLTNTIENYPGFPDGVGGYELGDLLKQQAEKFGTRIEFDSAINLDLSTYPYEVTTENKVIKTRSIIIATGASANRLNVPGEDEFIGKGVSFCATCDGIFFRGKRIVVVGGGDSAFEEAIFLTRFVESVHIIHRRDSFRASAILQKRVKENPKIRLLLNSVVNQVIGDKKVDSIMIQDLISGNETEFKTEGVFVFIGHSPNTKIFNGQIEMTEQGYIKIDNLMKTNIDGVFSAGEAADPDFKQVVTSAGMGAAAAIAATRFLENKN